MAQKNSATYPNPDLQTAATDTWQDKNTAPAHDLTAAATQVKGKLRRKKKLNSNERA